MKWTRYCISEPNCVRSKTPKSQAARREAMLLHLMVKKARFVRVLFTCFCHCPPFTAATFRKFHSPRLCTQPNSLIHMLELTFGKYKMCFSFEIQAKKSFFRFKKIYGLMCDGKCLAWKAWLSRLNTSLIKLKSTSWSSGHAILFQDVKEWQWTFLKTPKAK